MLKMERDYEKEYGSIPRDSLERLGQLVKEVNLSRAKEHVYDEIKRITNIPWKKLSFTIYLLPKATPRPRSGKGGFFYVKGAGDNKKFFQQYLVTQDIPLITTPVKFSCESFLPIPKSMTPVEKVLAEMGFIYPTSKPDWDNLAKTYCDMIQGLILYDDSLIVEGNSSKRYSTKPRIEITMYYMEDYDCTFNKKKMIKKGCGKE